MKVITGVSQFGRVTLEIVGESSHENSLLTLISQKAFEGCYLSDTAGSDEPTRTHMFLNYVTPQAPETVSQTDCKQADEFLASVPTARSGESA